MNKLAQVASQEILSLVYTSSAVTPFTPQDLEELLIKSRANNRRLGITGMLLHKDGNFMQVLEGDVQVVHDLYTAISKDRRHRGVVNLIDEHLSERQFSDWSMGFKDLDGADAEEGGYNEALSQSLNSPWFREQASRARRLLLLFRKRP